MRKHARDSFFVVGEGVLEFDRDGRPSVRRPLSGEELRRFRFSRLGPEGPLVDEATRTALAEAVTVTGGQPDSGVPAGFTYLGQFVDHDLTMDRPLTQLPAGTFGGRGTEIPPIQRNLAFRNLTRANMVRLATGQQMAELLDATPLTAEQILEGNGGAALTGLSEDQRAAVSANTPLWFYVLREAEFNDGRLGAVGGRIVAEVFHRAMEGSRTSIVRDPAWRPSFGPDRHTFRMTDLLLFAFEGKADLLNPLGD